MGTHSLACEVLHQGRSKPVFVDMQILAGKQEKSDHKNNIVVQSSNGNIILDHQIKTHDGWLVSQVFH